MIATTNRITAVVKSILDVMAPDTEVAFTGRL